MKNGRSYFVVVLLMCAKLVNTSCPSSCSCSSSTSGVYVNCYLKFLELIPNLPNDTYSLNFGYNSIHDIDVHFWEEMPLLKYIYLHNNKIQSIESDTFVNMTNLYDLQLYSNEISTIHQTAFMNLPSLRYLQLYNNEISTIEQSAFMNLPSLRYLYLHNNNLSTIKQFTFINLPNLQTLYLNDNKIKAIESNTFVNMTSLLQLQLHNNEISTIKQLAFVNLPNLQYLYLHNNELTSIVEYTFVNLPSLYYLILSGNNISLIEEHALGNLTQLSTLNLASNPLNCDCSIIPFWSWIFERPFIGISAKCGDGKFVISLRSAELDKCNPDNCQCFNGGKCITSGDGKVVCDCFGQWTGEFCLESQCTTYDCGFGNCFVEPINGTAQCVCNNKQQTYCPGKQFNLCDSLIKNYEMESLDNNRTFISKRLKP